MTGASSACCTFCRAPEDLRKMELVDNCDLSDGQPCLPCRDYSAIEVKVSAAKQVLNDLLVEQSKIRSRVNQNHDLLIGRVPTEIVRSVFQFCLPADDLDVFDDDKRRDINLLGDEDKRIIFGPLFLGRICKSWRDIAWKTEPLWTVVRIFLDRTHNPNYIDLAREWLERAGQLPLSLRISRAKFHTVAKDALARLIALINERSEQWKNMDIFGPHALISQFKGGPSGAPDLQAVRIKYSYHGPSDDATYCHFSVTGRKPQPSRLMLHTYELPLNHFDWGRLTTVCLAHPRLKTGIELLRIAPRITSYKLYEITNLENWVPRFDRPIIYGALESLEFGYAISHYDTNQPQGAIEFLQNFVFPTLTHLALKIGGNDKYSGEPSWAPVITHLEISPPPLKSLTIDYLGIHPFAKCILPILQISPTLQHLEILTPFFWEHYLSPGPEDGFIKFIELFISTSSNNQGPFLPNLQSLSLSVEQPANMARDQFWSCICRMCESTWDFHHSLRRPLKTLRLQLMWDTFEIGSEDIALRLLHLQEEGTFFDFRDSTDEDVFHEVIGRWSRRWVRSRRRQQ